jgi:acyl dehydratase
MKLEIKSKINLKFIVSDETYQGFILLFNDNNPLHTNKEFAISKGFKDKVMHGNILNGFLSYFVGECLSDKNVIIHSQEIQFKNPVYLDDELEFEAEVIGVYESVSAIEFKYRFTNLESKTVAKGKIQIGILK